MRYHLQAQCSISYNPNNVLNNYNQNSYILLIYVYVFENKNQSKIFCDTSASTTAIHLCNAYGKLFF